MLNQARKKTESFKLKNMVFIEQNISEYICSDELSNCLMPHLKVISILVVSAIPDWEKNLKDFIRALPNGSQFLIMDLFSEKRNLLSSFIDKVAQSDTSRKSWLVLEDATSNFMIWWCKIPFYFGVKAFIAIGTKTI